MPRKKVKPEDWLSPERLLLLQSRMMRGATYEELAQFIGTTRRSLDRWANKYPQIKQAISIGRDSAVASVENALFKKAQSGDLGAICFYLKNRAPDHWSEHPELRGIDGKVVFIDDIPIQKPQGPVNPTAEPASTPEQPDHP